MSLPPQRALYGTLEELAKRNLFMIDKGKFMFKEFERDIVVVGLIPKPNVCLVEGPAIGERGKQGMGDEVWEMLENKHNK